MTATHSETETIDRLFLELSQFTQAKTRKELAYENAYGSILAELDQADRFSVTRDTLIDRINTVVYAMQRFLPSEQAFPVLYKNKEIKGRLELIELIETKIKGVNPDSQEVVLEDDDWQKILIALEAYR